MRRITIVDDDERFVVKLKKLIGKYYLEKGVKAEISSYNKAQLVIFDINEKKISDLYLLDIEMPGVNGIELANMIKQVDSNAYIIFITSHLQFTLDAFDVQAYQYIPKSQELLINKLYKSLDNLEKEFETCDKEFYFVQTNSRYQRFLLKDIFYIYKDGKYSVIVTKDDNIFERETLKNIFLYLKSRTNVFYMLDRGYIINLLHVMKIDAGKIYMRDNTKILITKSKIKETKDVVYNFWKDYLK